MGAAHHPLWFDVVGLTDPQADMVLAAKHALTGMGRTVTPGGIVAELNLGFWTSLVSTKYEKLLWVPHLHKTFPNATRSKADKHGNLCTVKLDRKDIHSRLEDIRLLRNRIAHHESILKLDLEKLYAETIEALSWLCPTSAEWVRSTNCFTIRFKQQIPIPPPIVIAAPAPSPRPGMPSPVLKS